MVCLAGTIGTVYVSSTDYRIAKKKLDQIEAEYDAMPALSGPHGEYDIVVKELEDLQDLEALIVDPVPLSNVASAQYIYVDIDYSTVESGEDYLNREPPLRVEFNHLLPWLYLRS